jgi:hypothetical protein
MTTWTFRQVAFDFDPAAEAEAIEESATFSKNSNQRRFLVSDSELVIRGAVDRFSTGF